MTLPALGESVTEGTVTRWLKSVGDEVAVDEPLLEVSTDKVDTEIPSPVAGTLLEIKVEEDETVEVGAELAIVGSGDAAPAKSDEPEPEEEKAEEKPAEPEPEKEPEEPEPAEEEPAAEEEPEPQKQEPAAAKDEAAPAPETKDRSEPSTYVTPLVRKMAAQHGVELASISGTGVGGRIRKQDVLDAAKAKEAPAAEQAPAAASSGSAPQAAAGARRRCAGRPSR